MSGGEYQLYVQTESEAGRKPVTVSGWLKRQERARKRAKADAIAKAVAHR